MFLLTNGGVGLKKTDLRKQGQNIVSHYECGKE